MAEAAVAAVTGGTGFLGRWIVRALAEAGWQPRLLVRRDPVHPQLADLNPEIVFGAVSDRDALRRLVRGAGLVVHAAGLVKALSRQEFFSVNADGTAALAEATVAEAPGARVVLVSSLAAREPDLSTYAASKAAGEAALGRHGPSDQVVLRPAAVYGPWDREWLPVFRAARGRVLPIAAGPDARVCLIHAADVASAVVAAARPEVARGPFELSDATTGGYAWAQVVKAANRATSGGSRPLRVPAWSVRLAGAASGATAALTRRPTLFSAGKAREMLHPDWSSDPTRQLPDTLWRPAITLDRGFAETAAWYKDEGLMSVRTSDD